VEAVRLMTLLPLMLVLELLDKDMLVEQTLLQETEHLVKVVVLVVLVPTIQALVLMFPLAEQDKLLVLLEVLLHTHLVVEFKELKLVVMVAPMWFMLLQTLAMVELVVTTMVILQLVEMVVLVLSSLDMTQRQFKEIM
jgi:hypothetical protein